MCLELPLPFRILGVVHVGSERKPHNFYWHTSARNSHLSSCRAVSALLLLPSAAKVRLWGLLCLSWHLLLHTFEPDQAILRDGVQCLSIFNVA